MSMDRGLSSLKGVVAAVFAIVTNSLPATAQEVSAEELLSRLSKVEPEAARTIANEIRALWSQSGSPAMDLLLKRGRDAILANDLPLAAMHFTALTDHAPDFAEGWVMRATTYYQMDLYGPAIDDLQRALALNPNHFGALFGAGVIAFETGQTTAALGFFDALEAIHPHYEELSRIQQQLDKEAGRLDL